MIQLTGKRVLLIAPPFFGYDEAIGAEIMRRGASLVRLADRPYRTPLATALTKLAPVAVASAALQQYRRQLGNAGSGFDLCLVVNGQTIAPQLLREIRAANPTATMILYLWDSLDNRPSIRRTLSLYDCIYGFDPVDAQRFGFRYRPLFYSDDFSASSVRRSVDISFAGTAHSDRGPIIWNLDRGLPRYVSRRWFLYLQARWVRDLYALKNRRFRSIPPGFFSYRPLPKSALAELFARSRAILDIEHPNQRGLTMRTFETLGAGKKLVTTNRNVRSEDFFAEDRVLVIDRNAPVIPPSFLETDVSPLSADIVHRYSLEGWLDELLERSGVVRTDRS